MSQSDSIVGSAAEGRDEWWRPGWSEGGNNPSPSTRQYPATPIPQPFWALDNAYHTSHLRAVPSQIHSCMRTEFLAQANMRVLLYYFHPTSYRSNVNSYLLTAIPELNAKLGSSPGRSVTVRHIDALYETGGYKMTADQIAEEQKLILASHAVVFQFPCQWYTFPPSVSHFLAQVFVEGFAYGPKQARGESRLRGKILLPMCTFGTLRAEFATLATSPAQVVLPLRATADFVGMRWHDPLYSFRDSELDELRTEYSAALTSLAGACPGSEQGQARQPAREVG